MQLVDSEALSRVSKVLRTASSPSPETEFQDELLQQSVDVSRMLPGSGVLGGWVWTVVSLSHSASGNVFDSTDLDSILAVIGPEPTQERVDVWLMACYLYASPDGNDTIDRALITVEGDNYPGAPGGGEFVQTVMAGSSRGTVPYKSGGWIPMIGVDTDTNAWVLPQRALPMWLPPDAVIHLASSATVGVAGPTIARMTLLAWVGPKGQTPPGVA